MWKNSRCVHKPKGCSRLRKAECLTEPECNWINSRCKRKQDEEGKKVASSKKITNKLASNTKESEKVSNKVASVKKIINKVASSEKHSNKETSKRVPNTNTTLTQELPNDIMRQLLNNRIIAKGNVADNQDNIRQFLIKNACNTLLEQYNLYVILSNACLQSGYIYQKEPIYYLAFTNTYTDPNTKQESTIWLKLIFIHVNKALKVNIQVDYMLIDHFKCSPTYEAQIKSLNIYNEETMNFNDFEQKNMHAVQILYQYPNYLDIFFVFDNGKSYFYL